MTLRYKPEEPRWRKSEYDENDELMVEGTIVSNTGLITPGTEQYNMMQQQIMHESEKYLKLKRMNSIKNKPLGRYGHRCVLESYMGKNTMIVFGGYNGRDRLNDLYEYDLDEKTWTKVEFDPLLDEIPTARDCHSAVLYNHKMYIFAGGNGHFWLNDMFCYNCITKRWTKIRHQGDIPSGRAGHSANVYKDKMIVFAGWNGRHTLNDLYEFDFATHFWKRIQYSGSVIPQSRDSHSTCVTSQGIMYVIGGGDQKLRLNDVFLYHIARQYWTKLDFLGSVNAARAGHVSCITSTEDKIVIFGGGTGDNQNAWLTEVYELDLICKKWTLVDTDSEKNRAAGCYGLSAVVYNDNMVVFGGGDGRNWFNDVFSYKMDDNRLMKQTKNHLYTCAKHSLFTDVTVYCQEELTSTSCAVEEIGISFFRKETTPYEHAHKRKQEPYIGVERTTFAQSVRYSTIPFKTNSFE